MPGLAPGPPRGVGDRARAAAGAGAGHGAPAGHQRRDLRVHRPLRRLPRHGKDGAQDRYTLNRRTPEEVLAAITTGSMAQARRGTRVEFDKRVVAVYVGGRPLGAAAAGDASQMKNRCESAPAFEPLDGIRVERVGGRRRQLALPDIARPDRGRHAEARAEVGVRLSHPATRRTASRRVAGGRVFVGADTGFVYSLDATSGCVHWSFRADAGVRTADQRRRRARAHNRFLPTSAT